MKDLGIIASMQPTHCTSDMKWVTQRIGKERARYAYAWKSLLKAHVTLAFGSDATVEDLNPWPGLFAAVTRQNARFLPATGFFAQERISLRDAFLGFTNGAAFAAFWEKESGDLASGKRADFIVLQENPFKAYLKELREIQVEETYLGGIRVWPKKPLS